MKLTFIGATHEVTGSCFYLEACGRHILVECGMEQGANIFMNQTLPLDAEEVDAVLLTHAHIDHSGKLPLLYAKGFRGDIHATGATSALCNIMLQDSAHIQMFEAGWRNKKAKRAGGLLYEPLYNMDDALGAINLFVSHEYLKVEEIFDGIKIRFTDVGHLLGSASIEVWITENGITKKIVFSGDIGNKNQPIIKDPHYVDGADYVVMESTYGDRNHDVRQDFETELSEIIQETFDRGGNVVIPSFAVGRTQELLYFIRKIKVEKRIVGHGNFTVYVDSPLAIEATHIFSLNQGYFDEEATELLKNGINPLSFPGLKTAVTVDESRAINFDEKPKIIISASGMCEAGRIRHHLKHNLWKEENTILFVGFQAGGTLGRLIVDGAEEVRLFGDVIRVNAEVRKLNGISGHADKEGLVYWINQIKQKPEKVFIVHGEDSVCTGFAEYLKEEFGYDTMAPYSGTIYDLAANDLIKEGVPVAVEKIMVPVSKKRAITVYDHLVEAGERLMRVIRHNEGGANKDLAKFTSQINSLCDKWDR